jgi:hypothetical protein
VANACFGIVNGKSTELNSPGSMPVVNAPPGLLFA